MNPEPGDYVEVISEKGTFRGVLMPRNKLGNKDIIILKLDNGYNIGIIPKEIKVIKKGGKKKKIKREIKSDKTLPKISIIGTGGTIASYVDYRTGAVHPALTAEDLIFSVPEIVEECDIRASVLFNILSEDMHPEYWIKMARKVKEELKYSEGVVIPHGTDTMGYSAAALSFMFPKLSGPVVFVGAQRSSDRPSSDAYMNLLSAVKVAKSDLGEVAVVMHATTSDDFCHVHRGVRARKMHTSRRDAFKSVNSRPLGEVRNGNVKFYGDYRKKEDETELMDRMDEKVALIYYYPGMSVEHFERMIEGMHGAIIMGTGLGHVGTHLLPSIKRAMKDGIVIGMTSQCIHGRVNLNVYSTGRELKKAGVVPLEDMLPEVAYVKLMWLLGNYEHDEAKDLLARNLRGEISTRRMITW
ncbi:glutamyl-tRNA(Gln) amidotransferase, subunit D [Aciduliprofundum sp. MAR08-339]|uniref:Glu-tRNA(Gln) amidotransferase subunit GatD n=1 Tax=Aciduliprofundum sp. (strain MAR08-339) TaxID=673860 RepID=UPI0002A497C2|nr:glutamyl-tRNA(Gln) amidotransferase, subunit D [Aciduliprofundum sp. MAR08-339]